MAIQSYMRYSHVGIMFVLVFSACFYLGYYCDSRWHTQPWLTLLGCTIGFGAAFWFLIQEVGKK